MPTDEFKPLLDRHLSKARAQDLIATAAPLIKEIVNHATWAFRRCALDSSHREGEDLAAFVLYRQAIELADGVQVLLAEACPTVAQPPIRSLFEAVLGIEYILESKETYVRRSFAWLYCYTRERIKIRKQFDPATPQGREFTAKWSVEGEGYSIPAELLESSRRIVEGLEDVVGSKDYEGARGEYERLRRAKKGRKWYCFYGGPGNLLELATRLGHETEYEVLYRSWSRLAHATDASQFLDASGGTASPFAVVRDIRQFRTVAALTASLSLKATRLMVARFRSGEDLSSWYRREVQERYKDLCRA